VAIVIQDHDGQCVKMFIRGLKAAHWIVSTREVSYPEIGDTVADSCLSSLLFIHPALLLSNRSSWKPLLLRAHVQ
jgi:hypothetical protein